MLTVPLYGKKARGRVALIDDEDWPLVAHLRWNILGEDRGGDGRREHGPYAVSYHDERGRHRCLLMHNLIAGCIGVDHIDLDGLNNQRSNLRVATRSQNQANSLPRTGTSQYKGVSWERGYWRAQITVDRRMRMLGKFGLDEEAAARAYDAAAIAAWGEFARLNFP